MNTPRYNIHPFDSFDNGSFSGYDDPLYPAPADLTSKDYSPFLPRLIKYLKDCCNENIDVYTVNCRDNGILNPSGSCFKYIGIPSDNCAYITECFFGMDLTINPYPTQTVMFWKYDANPCLLIDQNRFNKTIMSKVYAYDQLAPKDTVILTKSLESYLFLTIFIKLCQESKCVISVPHRYLFSSNNISYTLSETFKEISCIEELIIKLQLMGY